GAEGGRLWFAMPLLAGGTLRDRLAKGPLPAAEAVALAAQLARTLSCAHERGVIHRDLKPANILFDGDRALVADLGLAKHFAREEPGMSDARTQTGMILGTPGYMA